MLGHLKGGVIEERRRRLDRGHGGAIRADLAAQQRRRLSETRSVEEYLVAEIIDGDDLSCGVVRNAGQRFGTPASWGEHQDLTGHIAQDRNGEPVAGPRVVVQARVLVGHEHRGERAITGDVIPVPGRQQCSRRILDVADLPR
ncbi:Uncharacterised protein [Mycobacteroides abscessus subsp. abscessus]|nr:Uncharacterised protein [Mycobacteroides abscessus subsp. abscessus]